MKKYKGTLNGQKGTLQVRTLTLHEKYQIIQDVGHTVAIPWEVSHILCSEDFKFISVMGDDISMGHDYVSLAEARSAVEWYVTQLGGAVKWQK